MLGSIKITGMASEFENCIGRRLESGLTEASSMVLGKGEDQTTCLADVFQGRKHQENLPPCG